MTNYWRAITPNHSMASLFSSSLTRGATAAASPSAVVGACCPSSSPAPRAPIFRAAFARAQSLAAASAPRAPIDVNARRPRAPAAAAASAAEPPPPSPPAPALSGGGGGNGEVVGGGAGTRLSPADLASVAGKKSGRPTSASGRVSDGLASVSLVVVGPSSDLNAAVAAAVGKRLGWFPVATRRVLAGMHKAETFDSLPARLRAAAPAVEGEKDGDDLVGAAEADVLRGLSTQFRCAVATLGGPASAVALASRDGAAATDALRRQLAGALVLWVDEVDRRGPSSRPAAAVERASEAQRPYAAIAEVRAALESGGGFGAATAMTAEQKADKAAGQIVATLAKLLEQDEDMPARKRAYVEEVLIGRAKLAEAAEKRAEGMERAAAAAAEGRQGGFEGGGGPGDGGGPQQHPLDR